ncbi:MAG TPA: tyrosine--tRNA ligase, partial [Ferruginibacter sp.]|nr:tyrosine--tRNA ligase [Ferruginibacter sp.]
HITVNYMMAKDSVKKRFEGDNGMSFTEFTYQLVQGYDFYWLYQHKGCLLQMGGSDQWGNIVTGTELIRRKTGGEAFAFTCPLIKKADGGKFGKTEKGNIWLDPVRTTPYQFYQFWLNASDEDASSWIRIFTFLSKAEIDALMEEQAQNPAGRAVQKKLAEAVTRFVHGEAELEKAIATTAKLFSGNSGSIEDMTEEDLLQMEGIVKVNIDRNRLQEGVGAIDFLAESGVFPSKGEARKLIQNGGLSINRQKVTDPQQQLRSEALLHNKFLLVQKGKKNYYLIEAIG